MRLSVDLERWERGELSASELAARHPDRDVPDLLDLHARLEALGSGGTPDPDLAWRAFLPTIAERGRRRGGRVLALAAALALALASLGYAAERMFGGDRGRPSAPVAPHGKQEPPRGSSIIPAGDLRTGERTREGTGKGGTDGSRRGPARRGPMEDHPSTDRDREEEREDAEEEAREEREDAEEEAREEREDAEEEREDAEEEAEEQARDRREEREDAEEDLADE